MEGLKQSTFLVFLSFGWTSVLAIPTKPISITETVPTVTDSEYDFLKSGQPVLLNFAPDRVNMLYEEDTLIVMFNFTLRDPNYPVVLRAEIANTDIAHMSSPSQIMLAESESNQGNGFKYEAPASNDSKHATAVATPTGNATELSPFHLKITGVFLGFTHVNFFVYENKSMSYENKTEMERWLLLEQTLEISIIRRERAVDFIFTGVIIAVVLVANISMGCKTELKVIKKVLKKPIPPAIGFGCQFIIMPTIAYGIAKVLGFSNTLGLGLFCLGCAPGGGASNMYSVLLDGDVSLSITMTMISTLASLGMVPLWLFTLGSTFLEDSNIVIPYQNIMISLVSLLIPVGIGVLIRHKRPLWAKKIGKLIKPMMIVIIIVIASVGVYANLYIFKMFTPMLILSGILMPWLGFSLGGLVALILCQNKKYIRTICIETGIQNVGVPMFLLKLSLPPPANDLAIVAVAAAATFTPLPLWIAVAATLIRKRCCKKKADDNEEGKSPPDENENETGNEKESEMKELHGKDSANGVADHVTNGHVVESNDRASDEENSSEKLLQKEHDDDSDEYNYN